MLQQGVFETSPGTGVTHNHWVNARWCYKWDCMGLIAIIHKAGHMSVVKMKKRRGGITRGRVLHERARQGGSPSSRGTQILRAVIRGAAAGLACAFASPTCCQRKPAKDPSVQLQAQPSATKSDGFLSYGLPEFWGCNRQILSL